MPARFIRRFDHREFIVTVAEDKTGMVACGWNADNQHVASATAPTQAEAEAEIKATLNRLSCQFVGIEAAITLFLRCFPAGFTDPFYLYDERTYKARAVAKARDLLSEDRLDALLATGNHRQILDDAARAMRVNLVQPYEQMAFGNAIQHPAVIEALPGLLRAMLYGDAFATALDEASALLAAHNAARWPTLTVLPFLVHPDRHMLLKPEVVRRCADGLGFDLDYQSRPNGTSYASLLAMTAEISTGIAGLNPADHLDVQTFMYVIGKEGYVPAQVKARKAWMAKQERSATTNISSGAQLP